MNLLNLLFRNRRRHSEPVKNDRRASNMKQVTERLDRAAVDLCETISMKRDDFLSSPADRLKVVMGTVDFVSFADNCEYQYSPPDSLMKLCKHPDHAACKSGIAACQPHLCPMYLKASRAK